MRYIQIKLHASRQGIEAAMPIFLESGADGVSVDDPADVSEIMDKKHSYDWDFIDESLMQRSLKDGEIGGCSIL